MTAAEASSDVRLGLPDVSVVVVIHDSADVIGGALTALPSEVEVVIVDNASGDGGAKLAMAARPDLTLISCTHNLGFGGGCQLGADAATRKLLLFLNPDARIDAVSIRRLTGTLARHECALVGPRLLDAAGRVRPTRGQLDIRRDAIWLLPFSQRWLPARWRRRPALDANCEYPVGFVEGACFMVRAADLAEVGGFDPDLFLYYEEASLAQRLRLRGGSAWYEPRASATHVGQASTAKTGAFATYHFYRSRVIVERKLFGDMLGRARSLVLLLAGSIALVRALVHRMLSGRPNAIRHALAVLLGVLVGMRDPIGPRYG